MDDKLRLLKKAAEKDAGLWATYAAALERRINLEKTEEPVSVFLLVTIVEGMLVEAGIFAEERLEVYLTRKEAEESRKRHLLKALQEIHNDEPELVTQLDILASEASPTYLEEQYQARLFPVHLVLIVEKTLV